MRVSDILGIDSIRISTGSTVRHVVQSDIPGYTRDWLAENMLPEGAHIRPTDTTYMLLNRNVSSISVSAESTTSVEAGRSNPFLFGLNVVRTEFDATVTRGVVVKALAIFSRYAFVESFKEMIQASLEALFANPEGAVDTLNQLYDSVDQLSVGDIPNPSFSERRLISLAVGKPEYATLSPCGLEQCDFIYTPSAWIHRSEVYLFNQHFPVYFPLIRSSDDIGAYDKLSRLVTLFKEDTMKIFNFIIASKRILFVGYNHSADDVCSLVLACAEMTTVAVPSIIQRVYPYANLSDMSFFKTKGFIAGVTNPVFQQYDKSFDVLIVLDLPNGRATIQSVEPPVPAPYIQTPFTLGVPQVQDALSATRSKQGQVLASAASSAAIEQISHEGFDLKFIGTVLSGLQLCLGHDWLRYQFSEYSFQLINMALDDGAVLQGSKQLSEKQK